MIKDNSQSLLKGDVFNPVFPDSNGFFLALFVFPILVNPPSVRLSVIPFKDNHLPSNKALYDRARER